MVLMGSPACSIQVKGVEAPEYSSLPQLLNQAKEFFLCPKEVVENLLVSS